MQAHSPFIINLETHPLGYTFHSLQESTGAQLPKPKKGKAPPSKSSNSRIANRLIKEIGLTSEIPPIIPQENPYSREVINQIEELPKPDLDFQQEEELQCEVKRQTQLPDSPAQWFSLEAIHQIEIQHFAEFFSGKGYKTPQLYQAYRNFMVEAYRHNPKRYLSFIPCRRVLKGDVSCLLKIYQFLLQEGVINYGLGPDGNYDFKSMSLAQISQMGKKPQSCLKKIPEKAELEETSELDTDNLTVTVINKNFSRSYRVYCQQCNLICGIVWYSLPLDDQRSRSICIDCFNLLDKEQSAAYVKTDITKKLDNSKQSRSNTKSNWGLDDNIKLLDFMGNCRGKSWKDIESQFESKRGLEDIVLQFMQFPISNFDPYQHQAVLKHERIQYSQQQHVQLLQNIYQSSPYAIKTEYKSSEQQPTFVPSSPLTRFKAINSMFISKVNTKIEELRAIENLWEETNLKVRQQTLVNRIHSSSGQAGNLTIENEESFSNQDQ